MAPKHPTTTRSHHQHTNHKRSLRGERRPTQSARTTHFPAAADSEAWQNEHALDIRSRLRATNLPQTRRNENYRPEISTPIRYGFVKWIGGSTTTNEARLQTGEIEEALYHTCTLRTRFKCLPANRRETKKVKRAVLASRYGSRSYRTCSTKFSSRYLRRRGETCAND